MIFWLNCTFLVDNSYNNSFEETFHATSKSRDQIDKFSALVGNFISESSEVVHVQVDETNMKIVSLNSP